MFKKIANLDLSTFTAPHIPGNRSLLSRSLWYVVNVVAFQSPLGGLAPYGLKALLLRAFGAHVGAGFVCKPRVNIKCPWFLAIGDNVWIGEGVWIDNQCSVTVGSNVCISQGCYIFTGNHDWSDPAFPFFCQPVLINDGAWITAFQLVRPGTQVPSSTVLFSAPRSDFMPREEDNHGNAEARAKYTHLLSEGDEKF